MMNLKKFDIMEAKKISKNWKSATTKEESRSLNPAQKASKYKKKQLGGGAQAWLLSSRSFNLYSEGISYWILIKERSSEGKRTRDGFKNEGWMRNFYGFSCLPRTRIWGAQIRWAPRTGGPRYFGGHFWIKVNHENSLKLKKISKKNKRLPKSN